MPASREELNQQGFVRVPGVFAPDQIADLRQVLEDLFSKPAPYDGDFDGRGKIGSIRFDVCARNERLRWLLVHAPMLEVLRSLLGDNFVFLPEMAANAGGFGDWHKDTTSQERAGHKFHQEVDFRMIQVAVYLQDNGDYGGGLDVIPGSRKLPDRYLSRMDHQTLVNRIRRRVTKQLGWNRIPENAETVPSQAGDLVCFDVRLDHKASWPRVKTRPANVKYAVFFMASANNDHARRYCDFIHSRADYIYFKGHQYPDDLLRLASSNGVTLMQMTPGQVTGSRSNC